MVVRRLTMNSFKNSLLIDSQPGPVVMKSRVSIVLIVRATILFLSFACTLSTAAQTRQWSTQPGTVDADSAGGLAVDNNYLYLVGTTAGTIGRASQGRQDGFLLQFDHSNGIQLWAEQI